MDNVTNARRTGPLSLTGPLALPRTSGPAGQGPSTTTLSADANLVGGGTFPPANRAPSRPSNASPAAPTARPSGTSNLTYTTQYDHSVEELASQFNLDPGDLERLNGWAPGQTIAAGTPIQLPGTPGVKALAAEFGGQVTASAAASAGAPSSAAATASSSGHATEMPAGTGSSGGAGARPQADPAQARANAQIPVDPSQQAAIADLTPAEQQKFRELSPADRAAYVHVKGILNDMLADPTISDRSRAWARKASASFKTLLDNGTLAVPGVMANLGRFHYNQAWSGYGYDSSTGQGIPIDPVESLYHTLNALANPSDILQGKDSQYCAPASVLARMALTDPAGFAKLSADLTIDGKTTLPDGTTLQVDPAKVEAAIAQDDSTADGRDYPYSMMMSTLCNGVGNKGDGTDPLTPAQYQALYGKFFPGSRMVSAGSVTCDQVLGAASKAPVSLMFYNEDASGRPVRDESHTVTVQVRPDGVHVFTNGQDKVFTPAEFRRIFDGYFAGGNFPPGALGGSPAAAASTGGSGAGVPPTGGSGAGTPPTGGSGAGVPPTGGSGAGAPPTGGSGAGTYPPTGGITQGRSPLGT